MSLESAREFIEKIKINEDLKKKVSECKDTETRAAFVKSQGFDFTADDIELAKGELSEEDLKAISGGEQTCGILPPYFFIEG